VTTTFYPWRFVLCVLAAMVLGWSCRRLFDLDGLVGYAIVAVSWFAMVESFDRVGLPVTTVARNE